MFERAATESVDGTLRFDVLIDQPHETLQTRRNQKSQLVADLAEYLLNFVATNGRWPATVEDANEIITAIGHLGFTLAHESELADLKTAVMQAVESRKLIGATDGQSVYVDVEELITHLTKHGGLNLDDVSLVAHMVGEPRGKSHWVATDKPPSKRARAHTRAALDRDGFIAGGAGHPQNRVQFDGTKLPEWDDVERVLDRIAVHGSSGDTVVLTVAQLQSLIGFC